MKYYKKTNKDDVLDVLMLTIDEYIEELSYINEDEELVVIDKNEFNNLVKDLESKHKTNSAPNSTLNNNATINPLSLKLTILNFFAQVGVLPTIKELDEYLEWLQK